MRFFHLWGEPASERVRLALGFKRIDYELVVPDFEDDELFFELGVSRSAPVVLWDDGLVQTESLEIWREIEQRFPAPSLFDPLTDEQWQSIRDWRQAATRLLDRLYAPLRPAYLGVADDEGRLASYKASVQARFQVSLEELANDRYGLYAQLDGLTHFKALGAYVAQHGFYGPALSVADLLLVADLFPLQLLDGVSLPIDLMYYFERVQDRCGVNLRAGLVAE